MPLKSIVWLASYPKSGNTWTRVFLANYLFDCKTPLSINQVHRLGVGDAVVRAYQMVAGGPFDPSDHRQALALRPRVLRGIVGNDADVNFVKTHNAREKAFGVELIPRELTRSAIYVVRHPLDVAVSYARHYGMTPEAAVDALSRKDNTVVGDRHSVPQYLGRWSTHVDSWTRLRDFPVVTVRYEDLTADPHAEFRRVLEHLGFPVDEERLDRAVRFSSFDELSAQEAKIGFVEKSPQAERFFHSGKAGSWREKIDPARAEAFIGENRRVMKRHGYL